MKKAILVFVVMAVLAAFADNPHITQLIELVDVALSSPQNGDVLTFNSSTGKWNNQQPATQDGPKIVVKYQQENDSGNITPVAIFTPTETAMYRANIVTISPVSSTCAGVGHQVEVLMNASDGSFLASGAARLGFGVGASVNQPISFRGISGLSWTVSTDGQFISTDDCPYSFYIVVEKL